MYGVGLTITSESFKNETKREHACIFILPTITFTSQCNQPVRVASLSVVRWCSKAYSEMGAVVVVSGPLSHFLVSSLPGDTCFSVHEGAMEVILRQRKQKYWRGRVQPGIYSPKIAGLI